MGCWVAIWVGLIASNVRPIVYGQTQDPSAAPKVVREGTQHYRVTHEVVARALRDTGYRYTHADLDTAARWLVS